MASTANNNRYSLLLICCLIPGMGVAADWKVSPSLAVSEHFSDNVNLQPDAQAQAEWITEISPRLTIRRDGKRLKVNVDYSLQGLLYANGTNDNKLRQGLNGTAKTELIKEWLFLDATARVSQEPNNQASAVGVGGPVGISNTSTTASYSLSPYIRHRFGSYATVEARLAQDGVILDSSSASDTNTTRYSFNAVSGNRFHPLSWNADFNHTANGNSGLADTSSERTNLGARYALSRKWGLRAQWGNEKNDYAGVTNEVREYSYAGAGVSYTPSRRFSLDVLYNTSDNGNFVSGTASLKPTLRTEVSLGTTQRAFGRSYNLDLTHRARRATFSLRYLDDLTTSQQQYLQAFGTVDTYVCTNGISYFLPGVTPPASAGCTTYLGPTTLVNQSQIDQTYRAKNLIGTFSYTKRRHSWTLNVFSNTRETQGVAGEDTTQGLQANWNFRPAGRTSYNLTMGTSQTESSGTLGAQEDELWNIGLTVTRQFQPKVSGSLDLRHQERSSDQANGDYSENSVAARINMTF